MDDRTYRSRSHPCHSSGSRTRSSTRGSCSGSRLHTVKYINQLTAEEESNILTCASNASSRVRTSHVVPDRVDENTDAGILTGCHHVGEFVSGATFGNELVGDLLVVGPPGVASDVFGGRGNLDVGISY